MKHNSVPKFWQWASGVSLLLVALAAGGLSLVVNVIAGLGVGIPVAIMFGLSDVGKVLIPIIGQGIGWTKHLRATYIVASTVSVICALFAMADYFGSQVAVSDNAAKKTALVEQRIDDLRSERDTLRNEAKAEAKRGGCGDNCKALHKRADAKDLLLQEQIAKRQSVTVVKELDGFSQLASRLHSVDAGAASTGKALILILAGILVMELSAHLAGPAASMIGIAMNRPAAKPVKKAPAKRRTAKAKKPDQKPVGRRTTRQVQKIMANAMKKPDMRKMRPQNRNSVSSNDNVPVDA